MSEDKMREEHWRQWGIAGMPKDKIRLAEETWKAATEACAAIKDAEIAELKKHNKDLRYSALANEQANYSQIERLVKERAARDLMIKELREAVQHAQKQPHPFGHLELFDKALANSEHHNSRALEKMLLEAEIKGLRNQQPVSCNARLIDCCNKLAELNKE